MKVIVVGAIAGGATVASQIKRAIPNANITVIGMEKRIGYGTCGMPFAIGGTIEDPEDFGGPNPKRFGESKEMNILTGHKVIAIHRDQKTVLLENLETKAQFTESYDKLILSPGARSRLPNYEGLDSIPFFSLKTYEDMEDILAYLHKEKPKSCAVIGSGFIGIELAEAFRDLNIQTSMILRGDRVMSAMDPEITTVLYDEMKKNGVKFHLNTEIDKIDGNILTLNNGEVLEVDFLAASIGTIPNTSLAEEANLTIGETKGVIVNEYMQTDDPDIYALGDIVECKDWVTGKPTRIQLAWHAHRQAFIIARHLSNDPVKINPFLGTTITKLFSLTAGMTGLSEQRLKNEQIEYETVVHQGTTNAGYYPGHGTIYIRVHYHPKTRQILGAQAVGDKGVDKRMDVIVTAIMGKLTVDDLSALELSYSPPYSSPKDPINTVGYKAK